MLPVILFLIKLTWRHRQPGQTNWFASRQTANICLLSVILRRIWPCLPRLVASPVVSDFTCISWLAPTFLFLALPLPGLICLPLSLSSFHLFLSLSLTGGVGHVAVLGGLRSEVKGHMSPLVSTTNGETYWPACVCLHMLRQACSPRSDVPLWYSPIFICEFGSFLQIIINISYKNKSSVLCKCSLSSFRSLNSKNILK